MFYIDPLKEETMFLKPWLVVYHDVISEKEMAVVKELALPKVNTDWFLIDFYLIFNWI